MLKAKTMKFSHVRDILSFVKSRMLAVKEVV